MHSTTKDSPANLSPAYIAGLFDGEGCVIARMRNGKAIVEISITQANPSILFEIIKRWNLGNVYMSVFSGRRCGRLRLLSHREIAAFIDAVLPHTYIKYDQLLLMRELIATPNVERAHRAALVAAIKELKH